MNVIIIDYGMGNLRSVSKAVERAGADPIITSNAESISNADRIILPGVGHFSKGMESLRSMELIEILEKAVLINKKPILGICLGMQLMMEFSEEGNSYGLGWFKGKVVRFDPSDKIRYKIPHMGWNSVTVKKNSKIFDNYKIGDELYFVHSYYVVAEDEHDILSKTNYDHEFTSAISNENIFGFQFHPEKSHSTGLNLMKNFIFGINV
jgi:imidazole glycerol-phosphate synthase subunit HisH